MPSKKRNATADSNERSSSRSAPLRDGGRLALVVNQIDGQTVGRGVHEKAAAGRLLPDARSRLDLRTQLLSGESEPLVHLPDAPAYRLQSGVGCGVGMPGAAPELPRRAGEQHDACRQRHENYVPPSGREFARGAPAD